MQRERAILVVAKELWGKEIKKEKPIKNVMNDKQWMDAMDLYNGKEYSQLRPSPECRIINN